MKKCIICGAPCKSKYCSEECAREGSRRTKRKKYREKHPATEKFYVFYDKKDFVRYFGTAEQLVSDGSFSSKNAVFSLASKIKSGEVGGGVLVLNCLV